MNNSESSTNLIKEKKKKESAASRLTSSELEFFEQLSTNDLNKKQKDKRFSNINTDKCRAWEHIHKHSNNINISEDDNTFNEIMKLKKK